MFIQEHNCETNEITFRELSATEISEREKAHKAQVDATEAHATAKAALLAKLGISEAEAKLLLGGN